MRFFGSRYRLVSLAVFLALSNPHAQKDLFEKSMEAASEAQKQGRPAEAEQMYLTALQQAEKFGKADLRRLQVLKAVAELYDSQARFSEAETYYLRLLSASEEFAKKNSDPQYEPVKSQFLATDVERVADFYAAQKKFPEAERFYRRAIDLWQKRVEERITPKGNKAFMMVMVAALAQASPTERLADVCEKLSGVYLAQDRNSEAETLRQRAFEIRVRELPTDFQTLATRADSLFNKRKYPEAEHAYRRLLEITEKQFGPQHEKMAAVLNSLGAAYARQGKYAQAETCFQRALALYEAIGQPNPTLFALCLQNYAALLKRTGHPEEAAKLSERANALRKKQPPEPN